MDEYGMRALLEQIAGDDLPPVRVSIELAARQGRCRLRWRRAYLPGAAPIAAAAAMAVLAGLLAINGGSPHQGRAVRHVRLPRQVQARLRVVPGQFSPLVPDAGFGWLPPGFSVTGPADQVMQTSSQLMVSASASLADGRMLNLSVYAAGTCALTGPLRLMLLRLMHLGAASSCPAQLRAGQRAPEINGAPAYWTKAHDSLIWEYGRNAWATLTPVANPASCGQCTHSELRGWDYQPAQNGHRAAVPSAATSRLLLKIASRVRYGPGAAGTYTRSRTVVYGFGLTGLPADWRPGRTGAVGYFAVLDGRLANVSWYAGPADDPTALGISAGPASGGPSSCQYVGSQSQYVTIDGAPAVLRTIGQPYKHWQSLCARDVDGLTLVITLDLSAPGTNDTPLPDASQVGEVLTVFSRLYLLGPDVAHWTTRPVH
jgi:hypothetical protein